MRTFFIDLTASSARLVHIYEPGTTTSTILLGHSTSTRSATDMPSYSSEPAGWTTAMMAYAKRLIANGEDDTSVIILLETEYPQLVGEISTSFIRSLRC